MKTIVLWMADELERVVESIREAYRPPRIPAEGAFHYEVYRAEDALTTTTRTLREGANVVTWAGYVGGFTSALKLDQAAAIRTTLDKH